MSYQSDRLAADKHLDQQKAIISKHHTRLDFNKAKIENAFKVDSMADCEENTDLLFFEYRKLRIACRVRFDVASFKYGDITIRSRRPSGRDVELDKINAGYGDYMLYCWGTREYIEEYIVIDLDEFRQRQKQFVTVIDRWNTDGSSAFNCYSIDRIVRTACCVVAELKQAA